MVVLKTAQRARTSLRRQNQITVHDYMREWDTTEVDLDTVAKWAIQTGRWNRPPVDRVRQCRRELARAIRAEMYTDPQGREVRRMHPARYGTPDGPLKVIWADHVEAKPKHMQVSLSQRRDGIRADVRQHKTDHESYNDNNRYGAQIPLFEYNFDKDMLEDSQPTSYPYEKPGGDESEG